MRDRTFEKVRDRRESDVRVRAHVDASSGRELRGPRLIEEYEGTDRSALL
jgi:hypothetical protein